VYEHDAWELYDLKKDPQEMSNLYDSPEHAALIAGLESRLAAMRDEFGDKTGKAITR
jgi:hypothetical protein